MKFRFNRITLGFFVFGISASFMLASAQVGKSNDSNPTTTTTTVTSSSTVSHGGTLSALSATSVTVDAQTCAIATGSPSTTGFKVGDHVGIGCINGVLTVLVELPTSGTSSTDSISALSSTSITVGQLTCSISGASPSLTGFTVGERVAAACTNGALVTIVPLPPLGGPIKATIDSITSGAIGYDGFSCLLGPSSPSLAAFSVHEPVYLNCVNGYLTTIVPRTAHDDGPTTTTTPTTPTPGTPTSVPSKLALRFGAIQLLSSSSITVGSLTCTVDATSPGLAGFHTGDRVGMVCVDGTLGLIVPLAGESLNTTHRAATLRHDLLLRYSTCVKHHGDKKGCRKATVRLKHTTR